LGLGTPFEETESFYDSFRERNPSLGFPVWDSLSSADRDFLVDHYLDRIPKVLVSPEGLPLHVQRVDSLGTDAPPVCATCGQTATCFGAYEGDTQEEYACDDCCAHGNEDGHCKPVSVPAADSSMKPSKGVRQIYREQSDKIESPLSKLSFVQ
jgi:hypothetical protein